mmetsp:Transcript_12594/g.29810  ORF Transcript_12594/g.29810 Transcript_12594/m.29810 type:complete len:220 (+) Transcript_12594:3917-4576(+)
MTSVSLIRSLFRICDCDNLSSVFFNERTVLSSSLLRLFTRHSVSSFFVVNFATEDVSTSFSLLIVFIDACASTSISSVFFSKSSVCSSLFSKFLLLLLAISVCEVHSSTEETRLSLSLTKVCIIFSASCRFSCKIWICSILCVEIFSASSALDVISDKSFCKSRYRCIFWSSNLHFSSKENCVSLNSRVTAWISPSSSAFDSKDSDNLFSTSVKTCFDV